MNRRTTFRILVALLVTFAVLAVCVSPLVDIPKTVLRAKQLAQLILLALICLATACAGIRPALESGGVFHGANSAAPATSSCTQFALPLLC